MLSRSKRFHGHSSLNLVYRRGQSERGQICAIRYMLNSKRKSYRASVVVSKKVSKSATVRNRIRRRIYEIVRSLEKDISGPYDIVLNIYNESVADIDYSILRKTIEDQMKRAGILGARRD